MKVKKFDILGQYWLYEIENDLASDDFGEATFNRGVGTHLNHARNYLQAGCVFHPTQWSIHKRRHRIQMGFKEPV